MCRSDIVNLLNTSFTNLSTPSYHCSPSSVPNKTSRSLLYWFKAKSAWDAKPKARKIISYASLFNYLPRLTASSLIQSTYISCVGLKGSYAPHKSWVLFSCEEHWKQWIDSPNCDLNFYNTKKIKVVCRLRAFQNIYLYQKLTKVIWWQICISTSYPLMS